MADETNPQTGPARARGGTADRILDVSLRLFTEQGYDATSLREIAEELGVTKAALYYHFRTKEEILQQLMATLQDGIGELASWAEEQPPGEETTAALLERAVDLAQGPVSRVMAMAQRNQTALRELGSREGAEHHGPPVEVFTRIVAPLVPEGAGYEQQMRARMALVSVMAGSFLGRDLDAGPDERRRAALSMARSLLPPG